MFRDLVANAGGGVNNANAVLTTFTPLQLSNFLELTWSAPRSIGRAWRLPPVQGVSAVGRLTYHRRMGRNPNQILLANVPLNPGVLGAPPVSWSHLIYAYMIENTGIVEIFRRALQAWLGDERLPFPTLETQYWIRASEELFFKSP